MFRSALHLMSATVITAVLGVAFWVVAARLVDAEDLGADAALIAAVMTLSSVAQLNGASAIPRFLPRLGERSRRALAYAYAALAGASVVVAAAFVALAPSISSSFSDLHEEPLLAGAYVLALALWSVFVVQDVALAALRRPVWIPVTNAIFAVAKLATLPVLLAAGVSHAVFASWMLPVALIVPPVTVFLFRRAVPDHVAAQEGSSEGSTTDGFGTRRLATFLAQDYAGGVLQQVGFALLPLAVVALLGARENAWFSISFGVVTALLMLAHNAVTAFTVEGAWRGRHDGGLVEEVSRRLLVPLAAAGVALAVLAPVALLPFGREYVDESTSTLRILGLSVVPWAVLQLYEALCRLEGAGRPILVLNGARLALLAGLTFALAGPLGIEGVALAWLLANVVVALGALRPLAATLGVRPQRRRAALPRGRRGALLACAAAACVAAPVLVALGVPPGLRLVAVLALLCLGPGAAALAFVAPGSARAELGLVLGVSLATAALAAQVLLVTGWEPETATAVLAGGSLAVMAAGTLRRPAA